MTPRHRVLVAMVVAALVAAAYWPAVDAAAGFVSDDFMILQRVRDAGGLAGARAFSSQSYYEYYRPVGFLAFAADWSMWGDNARASHGVSVLLHLVNSLLVFVLATRVIGLRAAGAAAALFAVHVAHHEAVYWYAARFDLLATAGVLAALVALSARRPWTDAVAGLLFFVALLAKESAVTFPIVALAAVVLLHHAGVRRAGFVVASLAVFALAYVFLRGAVGLPSMGGASRLPKLAALGLLPVLVLAGAHPMARPVVGWLQRRAWWFAAGGVAAATAAALWASAPWPGAGVARRALAAFAYAAAHTLSPIALDRAMIPLPSWLAGAGALAMAAAAIVTAMAFRHRVAAFLTLFALAAYIPVSSMTEGSRYLYLPFVPVAMAMGWAAVWAEARWRAEVRVLFVVVLAVGIWQLRQKGTDWNWAAGMTHRAAALIAAEASPCGSHDVVLATAPTRIRGVYCNINYEALRWLQACEPRTMRALIRLGAESPQVDVRWRSAVALQLRVRDYRGDFLTSTDLMSFQERVSATRPMVLRNAFGGLTSWTTGSDLHLTQNIASAEGWNARWFVFSDGELRRVERE